ncbi:hypothetical protein BJV78DRAFT_734687 [Lactifluus subvellereus]|nr:hypothetical protein BJV78DRAFT_734687 [Lactifluus subvellereus]
MSGRARFLRRYLRGLIRCHLVPHHPSRARWRAAPSLQLRHHVPEPYNTLCSCLRTPEFLNIPIVPEPAGAYRDLLSPHFGFLVVPMCSWTIFDQRAIFGTAPLSRLLRDRRESFNQLAMETRGRPQQYHKCRNVILGALLRILSPACPVGCSRLEWVMSTGGGE